MTIQEVATQMNLSLTGVEAILRRSLKQLSSPNKPILRYSRGSVLIHSLQEPGDTIALAVSPLNEKIVFLYYGLDWNERLSIEAIAGKFNLSNSQVRIRLTSSITKIRNFTKLGQWRLSKEGQLILELFLKSDHKLSDYLEHLEEEVIRLAFGLDNGLKVPLQSLATRYVTSKQQIQNIIKKGLRKLRYPDFPLEELRKKKIMCFSGV